jgi:hypothetical protein
MLPPDAAPIRERKTHQNCAVPGDSMWQSWSKLSPGKVGSVAVQGSTVRMQPHLKGHDS